MRLIGLTKPQSDVLFQLYKDPTLTQRDLCRINDVTEATLSVLITGLERKQLIKRQASQDDTRKKLLVLTSSAKKLEPVVLRIKTEMYEALIRGFTAEELRFIAVALKEMAVNLS